MFEFRSFRSLRSTLPGESVLFVTYITCLRYLTIRVSVFFLSFLFLILGISIDESLSRSVGRLVGWSVGRLFGRYTRLDFKMKYSTVWYGMVWYGMVYTIAALR